MSETTAAPLRVERSDGVVEIVLSAPERGNPISLDWADPPGSCRVSAPPSRHRAIGGRFPRRWPALATLAGSGDAFVGDAVAAAASPDGRDGVAAFLERRAPRFGASGG